MGSVFNVIGRGLRRFAAIVGVLSLTIAAYLAAMAAVFRRRQDFILEKRPGAQTLVDAKRVAVFAHYDRRGRVHDYVIHYLTSLRSAGFDTIFISNSPRFEAGALQKILPLCALAVRRKNVGYDFGAYKDGLAIIGDWSALDELILANDSVYGPFHDLAEVLSACDDSASMWGMTDSWSNRYHLQSYFLLFKKSALTAPCMAAFWKSVRYVQSKKWVISRYEIGLTQALLRGGLRCEALYHYRTAIAALTEAVLDHGLLEREDLPATHLEYATDLFRAVERGRPLNMMHHFWDHLITKMGCPFIKRELLVSNPARVPYVYNWEKVIRRVSDYDTSLIVRHVQASSRDRVI